MKKILGLDIGTNSIGWALIKDDIAPEILGMGSRIIPLSSDDETEFTKGNAISKNQKRTEKRSARRNKYRYKLRRKYLIDVLSKYNMMPDTDLFNLAPVQLFELRDKALNQPLTLREIGRILYHLNQKRGYKSSRKEERKEGEKVTDYLQEIGNREKSLGADTIGQFFSKKLNEDYAKRGNFVGYRIKEQVFNRDTYISEFDKIWSSQAKYHPDILSEDLKVLLRDEIIYHQRPLKSQKSLVSVCDFEGKVFKTETGKEVFAGPKVAPKSSPVFQLCKIWESINNISLKKRNLQTNKYENYTVPQNKKQEIFEALNRKDKLTLPELLKILGIKKEEALANALIEKKGIQGNLTLSELESYIPIEFAHLLEFQPQIEEYTELADANTGEAITRKRLKGDIEKQPLYQLWHCIYSIENTDELKKVLETKFSLPTSIITSLVKIDFTKQSFGNKSVKAMRKILPYLMDGLTYDKACYMAGYNHSDSLTKEENLNRKLKDKLKLLEKNSLRQPIVEKILNQVINLVNAVIKKYGRPDEIRVELARELKQSREERNTTFKRNNDTEKNHNRIRKLLEEHSEFAKKKVTNRDIERYKLWEEFEGVSPYDPGKLISISELYSGIYDIEHILPKSIVFDDSYSNKTLCPRKMNSGQHAKNQLTGYDFMKTRSKTQLDDFLALVQANKKISRTKRNKLLMAATDISSDFIERQLRETQYISRKSREILGEVCRDVYVTSGKVTSRLRNLWGWENALMDLQLPKYRSLGLVEIVTYESNGQTHKKETIPEWSKRDDHRHHALDALTIAATKQGFIQRINTLNAEQTRNEMYEEVKNTFYNEKLSLLDKYLIKNKPFETAQVSNALENVLISFKSGKRIAVKGNRKIKKNGKTLVVQKSVIIPRGPLSEENVYGKIKSLERNVPINKAFLKSELIFKDKIRELVNARIAEYPGDIQAAIKSLKASPIMYKDKELTYATMLKDESVRKYPIESLTDKDLKFIVDTQVRDIITKRLIANDNNTKAAFKDLANNPVWLNEELKIPIHTVRCYTKSESLEPLYYNKDNEPIAFVIPGNNQHLALYKDENGKVKEHIVSFWHAVERKKMGLPGIIYNPLEVHQLIEEGKITTSVSFIEKLPARDWEYISSFQLNEMVIFDIGNEEFETYLLSRNYKAISEKLYRVQKISSGDYNFRHHLETKVDNKINGEKDDLKFMNTGRLIRLRSEEALFKRNPIKVRLNNLGEIVQIGV